MCFIVLATDFLTLLLRYIGEYIGGHGSFLPNSTISAWSGALQLLKQKTAIMQFIRPSLLGSCIPPIAFKRKSHWVVALWQLHSRWSVKLIQHRRCIQLPQGAVEWRQEAVSLRRTIRIPTQQELTVSCCCKTLNMCSSDTDAGLLIYSLA